MVSYIWSMYSISNTTKMDNGNRQEKLYTIHEFMMSSDYIERKKEKKRKEEKKGKERKKEEKEKETLHFQKELKRNLSNWSSAVSLNPQFLTKTFKHRFGTYIWQAPICYIFPPSFHSGSWNLWMVEYVVLQLLKIPWRQASSPSFYATDHSGIRFWKPWPVTFNKPPLS